MTQFINQSYQLHLQSAAPAALWPHSYIIKCYVGNNLFLALDNSSKSTKATAEHKNLSSQMTISC